MGYKSGKYRKGKVAAASIGDPGTPTDLLVLDGVAMALIVFNTLDEAVILSLPTDGTNQDAFELEAGEGVFLSADAVNRHVEAGTIKVYYEVTPPTTGTIRVTAVI